MAIIYTYPTKTTPNDNDLIIISDSEDSNKTKQVKISSLPGGSSSGVSSVTATLPLASTGGSTPVISLTGLTGFGAAGQVIKVNSGADGLEWGAAGGGSVSITADNSSTDYVDIQVTPSPITGTGTIMADLNAVNGTSDTTTRFLSKDNTWDVPSYTTDTTYDIMGSGNSYAAGLVLAGNATHGNEFLRKDGTWATPTDNNTNIGGNNLILSNNRTLNFYSDTTDKSLTFISTISGTKTLFKFDTVTNKPRFTVGDTASAYEGTLDIKGNGSNRTGKINLYNAAGTYSINIQAPTTFGANLDIPYVLPNAQGGANTFLQNNGSGVLTWAVPATNITLTTTGSSGAATWNGTTLNIPQYTGGSGSSASLGFAPLEIYSANGATQASYIYYMVAVCDVDLTVNKCKVAVTSGTGAVYVAVYSMNYGSLQTSTLTKLGDLSIAGAVAGVNELSLVDSAFSLTAGQTICIGVSTANLLSAGTGINNTDLGVMATSGGGSALPTTPDFEGLGSANKRPAIHFYAS